MDLKTGSSIERIAGIVFVVVLVLGFAAVGVDVGQRFARRTDGKHVAGRHAEMNAAGNPSSSNRSRRKSVRPLLAISPESEIQSRMYFEKGRKLSVENRTDEALKEFIKSLDINPNDTSTLQLMALIYSNRNDRKSATVYFKRLLAIEPGNVSGVRQLVDMLCRERDYKGALQVARKALDASPDEPLFKTLFKIVEADMALTPEDDKAFRAAKDVFSSGKYAEADNQFIALLRKYPENIQVNRLHALSLVKQGKMAEAVQPLEIFTRAVPFDYETFRDLAKAYSQTNKYEESAEICRRALRFVPDDDYFKGVLGEKLETVGWGNKYMAAVDKASNYYVVVENPPPEVSDCYQGKKILYSPKKDAETAFPYLERSYSVDKYFCAGDLVQAYMRRIDLPARTSKGKARIIFEDFKRNYAHSYSGMTKNKLARQECQLKKMRLSILDGTKEEMNALMDDVARHCSMGFVAFGELQIIGQKANANH